MISRIPAAQLPPGGVRKVVLATNIAETSLTISDVVYVVDAGRLKERRHNAQRGMSLLVEDFVSQVKITPDRKCNFWITVNLQCLAAQGAVAQCSARMETAGGRMHVPGEKI